MADSLQVLWALVITAFLFFLAAFQSVICLFRKWDKGQMSYRMIKDIKKPERHFMKAYRAWMLAVSDSQTLVVIAYWLNFWLIQKCGISAYHYEIAINIGLISCANFVLSTSIVKEYWKAPASALFRYMAILVIFGFLGTILNHQRSRIDFPEFLPPLSRNDSALLLPASCFLSSGFKDIYGNITEAQRQTIGYPMKRSQSYEFEFYLVNVIGLIISLARTIIQCIRDRHPEKEGRTYSTAKSVIVCLNKLQAICVFLAVNGYALWRIISLRRWVDHSEWIKPGRSKNPENDWLYNGQILPLVLMLAAWVIFSDEWTLERYAETSSPDQSDQSQNQRTSVASSQEASDHEPARPSPSPAHEDRIV